MLEARGDEASEGGPDVRLLHGRWASAGEPLEDVRARERRLTRQRLVEDEAGGEDVGPGPDLTLTELLGRHVEGGPRRGPGARQAVHVGGQGDPEVRQAEPPLAVEQDVLGLDVSVDDAAGVGVTERVGELPGQVDGRGLVERPGAEDALGQGLAVDELEDEVGEPVLEDAGVEHADDAWVAQASDQPPLALEPLARQPVEAMEELGGESRRRRQAVRPANLEDRPGAPGAEGTKDLEGADALWGQASVRRALASSWPEG